MNSVRAKYTLGEKNDALGTKLSISLAEDAQEVGTILTVLIHYATSPDASAVQWLEPEATKGGKYPYVFTQSQVGMPLLYCLELPNY